MSVVAWKTLNAFREGLADGTIDLDNDTFKMLLVTSAWTPNAETDSAYSDIIAHEHASGNGYTTGGATVAATWTRSTATVTFDCADAQWTANGGPITARYAVIYDSTAADALVAYSLLDSTPADVTAADGIIFKVTIHTSGVFTLTGMT